ncbi:hypothetical protein [Prescottella agglutinans]|uniref:Uncharacterized protein YegL n=1 Tax=Prescottella agglutinans TaxID=1644129 RepID=A0ABT6MHC5_9NOCA|nr:hypothetical protein [Prescottella agglutinans]MDH6283280.1 uncharacterized protein YegL [Prescottella agglutinans]
MNASMAPQSFIRKISAIPTDGEPLDIWSQAHANDDGTVERLVVIGGQGVARRDIPALLDAICDALAALD